MTCVLVLEDDEDLRDGIASVLEVAGHEVIAAEEGDAGLRLAEHHRPDLLISDLVMEGKEGIATIMEFKRIYADIPILSISGNPFYLQNSAKLGADASLLKPFTQTQLLNAVQSLLTLPRARTI